MSFNQFTNLDFNNLRTQIKDYLRANSNFTDFDFEGSNFSTLIDLLAYNSYITAFNTNMAVNEVFLDSATLRENVVSLARNIGYLPRSKRSSKAKVNFTVDVSGTEARTVKVQAGQCALGAVEDGNYIFSIPEDVTVVIMDTGTRRELRSSEYNRRRESCESAALELGVPSLRNALLEDITNLTDETLKRRARHVVSENGRVLDVVKAFSISDSFTAGQLFSDSHLSLRDDYNVSGPALNQIVEVALGAPGCFGARMTGGGFAGSAVALVDRNEVNNFCDFVKTNFTAPKTQPAITSVKLYPVEACVGVSVFKA